MKYKLRGYLMDVLYNHVDKCSIKRDLQESLAYRAKGNKMERLHHSILTFPLHKHNPFYFIYIIL